MKRIFFTNLFLASVFCAFSQGTMLLRQPTVSQDKIVFVHANDLWVVDRSGGDATRLTTSIGAESFPHFSTDGKWIAFSGQYDGNIDVFIVPVEGGAPKRLTYHPGADRVQGWSPDGKVIFASIRKGHPTRLNKFYTVSVDGGFPTEMSIPRIAYGEISPDGKYAAYTPITSWDPEWRNYRGGQAMPIWILDLKTNELQTTPQPDKERHLDPVWFGGEVYFLSERDYTSNIWKYNLETKAYTQITFHTQFDVKSLDASNDLIVYEQGGYLHSIDPKTGDREQLEIKVKGDLNWARERWDNASGSAMQNASLSPTGKRALFEYRGEIFTVPKENGSWRNISKSSFADRYPVWSPDGNEIAWFTDRSGEYQLVISDQFGSKIKKTYPLPNPTFYFRPTWSPDGKYISYTDTDFNMWVLNLESGEAKKADTERYAHPNRSMNPVWSPDSKWIAYVKLTDAQFKVVKAYNIESGKIINISDQMADALAPVWDSSGKYMYFLASTNWGLNTGWLDMSSYNIPVTRGLYAAILSSGDPSPLLPQSDEEVEEEKGEEGDSDVSVSIDDGVINRIIALDVPQRNYTGLVAGPENTVFYGENVPNQNGITLHKYDLSERESSEFMSGIQSAQTSSDGKQMLYRSGSNWGIVSTSGKSQKPTDGRLSIDIKMRVKPSEEWQQIYKEAWRYQRDFLYVNNQHGAPWDQIYTWYKPWVNHVKHRQDMNYIIDILGGEIAVGHSYTRGGDYPDVDRVPVGLLGADYSIKNGKYQIAKIFTGENWNPNLQAPLAMPGIDIDEGDYLLEVNGVAVEGSKNIYSFFEQTAGSTISIKVGKSTDISKAKMYYVEPISNEYGLRSRAWIEDNRRYVDEKTDGKIGYTYVPNTGGPGYQSFNRYYFAQQDKQGMIVDERNNGGGSAADYIADVMNRKLYGYFNSKVGDHKPWTTPMSAVWGPKVMIINERAGSGGDLLPYLFREMKIGTLVGTRTWGGLVGTWDTPPFIDGGRMIAPRGGFFDVNGEWAVEGEGIAPDVEVIQEPKLVLQGKDPQLDKAIEIALEKLETDAVELKKEPAPPIRSKRATKKN
ncbi:S41 family peptidase [Ekhidna sp. To15]|uniref:S41 family peptidase n=1 Tax=Ekhidna sp. To15 TaxID=3395267 RepID=UPI003F52013B